MADQWDTGAPSARRDGTHMGRLEGICLCHMGSWEETHMSPGSSCCRLLPTLPRKPRAQARDAPSTCPALGPGCCAMAAHTPVQELRWVIGICSVAKCSCGAGSVGAAGTEPVQPQGHGSRAVTGVWMDAGRQGCL